MVSLAGVALPIVGVIITTIALYEVIVIHWGWGVPFVFIGVICLVSAFVISLLQ